jgi:superfamily II DNA/RNA helicase
MKFTDFNLKSELNKAIESAGFTEPSPVQKDAIPEVLKGKDIVAQAQTGTGKTAAFGLPVLNMMKCDGSVEMVVVVPTRELAMQVSDELFKFGKFLNIKTATVYGGSSYSRQIKHVESASIIVATQFLSLFAFNSNISAVNKIISNNSSIPNPVLAETGIIGVSHHQSSAVNQFSANCHFI